MNLYTKLIEYLDTDEQIEAVVFGNHHNYDNDIEWEKSDLELFEEEPIIPFSIRGKILKFDEAIQYIKYLEINPELGRGTKKCNGINIWTDKRIIFICVYDGGTWLDSVYRNPTKCFPDLKG